MVFSLVPKVTKITSDTILYMFKLPTTGSWIEKICTVLTMKAKILNFGKT